MIYITTKAYNAEKTLKRTIESVLSQSSGNFIYYICDNGSGDGTGEIINEYSKIDKRIVPFFQKVNSREYYKMHGCWTKEIERYFERIMFYLKADDWYCVLDADDEYHKDFLSEMLDFAEQEQLDYVACRSNFIRTLDMQICNDVTLEKDLLMKTKEQFDCLFPYYFRYMGAYWGKIHKGSVFQNINRTAFEKWLNEKDLFVIKDTATELYFLRFCKSAGVHARLLHNYYIYPKGESDRTKNIDRRIEDNLKMPDIYREFLIHKVGYVSENNEKYICEVFEKSQKRDFEIRSKK